MFKLKHTRLVKAANKELSISGILPRIAKLSGEYHEYLDDPEEYLSQLNEPRSSRRHLYLCTASFRSGTKVYLSERK